MSREASIRLNCMEYTTDIKTIVQVLLKIGWKLYNTHNKVEFLPLGDEDDYNWQEKFLTENDALKLVADKQAYHEMIGLNLFHEESDRGVTLLARETSNISLCLEINRKRLNDDDRDSFTDFTWYFNNIIKKMDESGCILRYIKYEEYLD